MVTDLLHFLMAETMAHLPDSLDKGLALDITDGAADLGDDHIRTCPLSNPINEALDLIGDMGNGLHGAAQVLSSPLLGDDIGVDLAVGIDQCAGENTHKQRRMNRLGQQRQHNGDDRRQQGQNGGVAADAPPNHTDGIRNVGVKIRVGANVGGVVVEVCGCILLT